MQITFNQIIKADNRVRKLLSSCIAKIVQGNIIIKKNIFHYSTPYMLPVKHHHLQYPDFHAS